MAMKEQLEVKLLTVTEEATYLKSKQDKYSDELHNLFLQVHVCLKLQNIYIDYHNFMSINVCCDTFTIYIK